MKSMLSPNKCRTNRLTVRIEYFKLNRTEMEQSVKKLIREREQIYEQMDIQNKIWKERIRTINTALEIIDMRLADPKFIELEESLEKDAFQEQTLPNACGIIFAMYSGWMDKNQVEYLLTVGGYRFDAKDPTNSVDVTLRRMAEKEECEVDKHGGSRGNRYRRIQTKSGT